MYSACRAASAAPGGLGPVLQRHQHRPRHQNQAPRHAEEARAIHATSSAGARRRSVWASCDQLGKPGVAAVGVLDVHVLAAATVRLSKLNRAAPAYPPDDAPRPPGLVSKCGFGSTARHQRKQQT